MKVKNSFELILVYPIELWTKEDVQNWFQYCIEEYALGDIAWNDFQMNGQLIDRSIWIFICFFSY